MLIAARLAAEDTPAMIQVALMGLPRMLDDIVSRLVDDDPEAGIVGRLGQGVALDDAFVLMHADVVVCAAPENEVRGLWEAALRRRSPRAIVNVGVDAGCGSALTLKTVEHTLGPVSEQKLMETLHAVVED